MTAHDEFLNDDMTPEDEALASAPLDAWTQRLVQDAMHVEDASIPREMMWARIRQARSATATERVTVRRGTRMRTVLAIAATLIVGVAIGRYAMPGRTIDTSPSAVVATGAPSGSAAGSAAGASNVPTAAQAAHASDPAVVAMEEHFARTVALLTTVRDESPDAGPGADVTGWARELLGTTRMLLDEPSLRDDRTRRLLQDLELVLVQIIQARGTAAPEARRAPSETMRETNLLPRVRAVVTASVSLEESTIRGVAE